MESDPFSEESSMTIEEIEKSIASYGEDVFRFCCYLTGNRSSAQDLYQDTFLKAMEITRPVEPDMTGKFLAGVAANLWKNQWRKEKRRQKYIIHSNCTENGTAGEDLPGETDLLQDYVKQETEQLVQRVVNALPEKYRVVVLLHYSMDLTTQEIADQLKISRGTVTSRLLRAGKKIKQELEANGYER